MNSPQFHEITGRYHRLSIAVLGDFCLDRYLEIDPALEETSIETGQSVFNVVRVRAQPGGAGTVLNNLVALGIGEIIPLGFSGDDGEGFELIRAMQKMRGVRMDRFLQTPHRHTFTYCKPLVVEPGKPPRELNRLDLKNWSPTPAEVQEQLIAAVSDEAEQIDALVIMDQVDLAGSGVLAAGVLDAVGEIARRRPQLRILADSRRGLHGYPAVCWKMNRAELGKLRGGKPSADLDQAKHASLEVARRNGHEVFVTLAEEGMLAATPDGQAFHARALPVRGEIDIVGAGDAVTANLVAALAAGASPMESLQLASAAASVVIHQLGTTGTASVCQIAETLGV
ncbi:MAG: bifunctional heptose 7-phosphate kinase/heptose 1-phosphate adenyltransferase [Thermoguttaceae bacterium]